MNNIQFRRHGKITKPETVEHFEHETTWFSNLYGKERRKTVQQLSWTTILGDVSYQKSFWGKVKTWYQKTNTSLEENFSKTSTSKVLTFQYHKFTYDKKWELRACNWNHSTKNIRYRINTSYTISISISLNFKSKF